MSKKQAQQPDAVTVRFDLHDLPTAQHKAGLAGLLLQIASMKERVQRGALPKGTPLVEVTDQGPTHAAFRFTAASVQALFDDLYAAKLKRIWVDKKWKDVVLLDTRSVTDKKTSKPKPQFQYEVVEPAGLFLRRYTDGGKERWHKLWRETLWSTSRVKPKTLEKKFAATVAGKPAPDGQIAWKDFLAHEEARHKGAFGSTCPDTAVLLAAQKENAERVEFLDRADHAALLHFWQLTARVFVPEQIDAEGKRNFVGYVLAIPEVSDLQEFGHAYLRGLNELTVDVRGYRPAEAVVSIAAEGSLEFMRHLMAVAERRAIKVLPERYLGGVEFFHMVKAGNNIKTVTHGRVPPRESLLAQYDGLRKTVKNPLMLAGRLRALLDEQPWFAALADELVEREWSWFVHATKEGHRTPPAMVGFAWEAAEKFNTIERNYHIMSQEQSSGGTSGDAATKPTPPADAVDRVIYRLVDQYVVQKARARMNVPEDAARQSEHTHRRVPGRDGSERWQELPKYQEERRHVASGLFLALRSRHGDDFVEHFTAALGSVAQYLPADDYEVVAAALMRPFTQDVDEHRPRTRDDVKTLTLLALSAHSRSLTARQQAANTEPGTDAEEESAS